MTIYGHVEIAEVKQHGKSAKLKLRERDTVYTFFDTKLLPIMQPGAQVKFEAVEQEYKDTKYWKIIDNTLRVKPPGGGEEQSVASMPAHSSTDYTPVLLRIASALEAIARAHDKKEGETLEALADTKPEPTPALQGYPLTGHLGIPRADTKPEPTPEFDDDIPW